MKQLIFLSLLLSALAVNAHQLTPQEALQRFNLQQSANKAKGQMKAQRTNHLTLAYTKSDANNALMYIMNQADGDGFVILGADDCAPALIGYVDHGTYNADKAPENFKAWIEEYAQTISTAISDGQTIAAAIVEHEAIEPLVTTEWNQLYPYNKMCTDRGSNFGVYTGCVATAMAQVINYHKYPEHGYGEHSYTFPTGSTTTYTGYSNFAEHTYDWAHMLNTYASYGNGDAAEDAVATLMHDCGVAVDMDYETTSSGNGSGASHNLVAQALINYFGYDRSIRTVTRCYYSDEEWETMMLGELEAGRPVVYAGSSTANGGHEFVLDGYDGNGRYHFNWGWSGDCDGYFLLSGDNAINPYTRNANHGTDGDNPDYAFNISQAATIGIQPDKGTKDVEIGMGLPAGYTLGSTESAYRNYYFYIYGYLWNTGVLPQKVIMGVKYVNVDNANEVYYDAASSGITFGLRYYYQQYYVYQQNIIKPGTYYVYPVFKDADDPHAQWQDVKLPYGYTDIPTLKWTASQPAVSIPSAPKIISNDRDCSGYKLCAKNVMIKFTLEASTPVSEREFCFELYSSSSPNTRLTYFDGIFINQSAGESKEYEVSLDNILSGRTTGEYFLKIKTWNDATVYPKYNSYIYFTLVEQGDVDGDGKVLVVDLTKTIQLLKDADSKYYSPADMDNDGNITIKDAELQAEKVVSSTE